MKQRTIEGHITLSKAAEILHCSRSTMYRILDKQNIKPVFVPAFPKTPLFKESVIRDLIKPENTESLMNANLHKTAKERDNFICCICGSEYRLVAHHIKPIEQGGDDVLENLITLCKGCHTSLHSSGISLFAKAKKHKTLSIALWLQKEIGLEEK